MSKVSAKIELATLKRIITLDIEAVEAGFPAPSATAIKLATDAVANLDIYITATTFSWEKVS